jgi:glycosyltransferase involved in cell wall biosynthesis
MSRRLRVLFFIPSLSGGGVERQVARLLTHLDRRRFDPRLAVARLQGPLLAAVPSDVPVTALAPRWVRRGALAVAMALRPLRRLMDEWAPDLVYTAKTHANVVALRARSRAQRRPKVLVSVANTLSVHPRRHRTPLRRLVESAARVSYPAADAVICISEGVRRDLNAFCPALAGKAVVIHNMGIADPGAEIAGAPVEPIPSPLVVACGRLTAQKGFDTLVRAFADVRQHVPASLWILGEGPDRRAIQALVDRLGLCSSVRLLGFRDNPYPYFARAQAFVLSSRWEGFGNVLVEAMACGTPVLATRCRWGPDEIVLHEVSGLLCEPESAEALARGLLRLLQDRELADALAAAGRRRARDFAPDVIVAQHEALFTRVAASREP